MKIFRNGQYKKPDTALESDDGLMLKIPIKYACVLIHVTLNYYVIIRLKKEKGCR
jgi:hypothetical protein